MALVQCNDIPRDEILRYLVDALSETAATVRMDAAAALAQMDGREVALLLRLKGALEAKKIRASPDKCWKRYCYIEGKAALPFLADFLERVDEETAEEAALALGASRMPEVSCYAKRGRNGKTNGRALPCCAP